MRLPSTVETIVLGPAVVNLASITAVQIGTTPAGARFVPLEVILLCTAASAPTGVAASTLGVGQTGPGFTDWLSTSLDATFNAQHEVLQVQPARIGDRHSLRAGLHRLVRQDGNGDLRRVHVDEGMGARDARAIASLRRMPCQLPGINVAS